jgi:hypothetical protein
VDSELQQEMWDFGELGGKNSNCESALSHSEAQLQCSGRKENLQEEWLRH